MIKIYYCEELNFTIEDHSINLGRERFKTREELDKEFPQIVGKNLTNVEVNPKSEIYRITDNHKLEKRTLVEANADVIKERELQGTIDAELKEMAIERLKSKGKL